MIYFNDHYPHLTSSSSVSNAGMQSWEEVRTCTPSQKKLESLEMHLRTQRYATSGASSCFKMLLETINNQFVSCRIDAM